MELWSTWIVSRPWHCKWFKGMALYWYLDTRCTFMIRNELNLNEGKRVVGYGDIWHDSPMRCRDAYLWNNYKGSLIDNAAPSDQHRFGSQKFQPFCTVQNNENETWTRLKTYTPFGPFQVLLVPMYPVQISEASSCKRIIIPSFGLHFLPLTNSLTTELGLEGCT